jgi:hypothetical protein
MIPLKLDAWYDSTGQKLFAQFNGYAIPLLVFLNGKGEELDRVVGYRNVDEFLSILNNVLNNEDTYMSLSKKFKEGNRSVDIIDKLSIKSEERQDNKLSTDLYNILIDRKSEFDEASLKRAIYFFAKQELKSDNPSKMNIYISKNLESEKIGSAFMDLIRFYSSKKDTIKEVQTYKNMISSILSSKAIPLSSKPSFLNSYAWRMSELEINLDDALLKSTQSVKIIDSLGGEMVSSIPMFLDTKAEILWKMNRVSDALNIITKAIDFDPNNEYYREQKTKFQHSIKGN